MTRISASGSVGSGSTSDLSRRAFVLRGLGVGMATAVPGLLAACGADDSGEPGAQASGRPVQGAQPMTFTVLPGVDTAPLFAAVDQGFYADHGIDAKALFLPAGPDLVAALASEKAGIAGVGTFVTFTSVAKGVPLKILAMAHDDPTKESYATSNMVAGPDSGIGQGDFAALKGKKVAYPVGTDAEGALRAFLREAGLSIDDVETVNAKPPDTVTALEQGSVDAICVFEPWPSVALVNVDGSTAVNTESAKSYSPGVLVATTQFIEANGDLLRDYLTAVSESYQWARQNPDELIPIITRNVKGLAPEAARMALDKISLDPRVSKLVLDQLQSKTVPLYRQLGALEADIDVNQAVDFSIMAAVQRESPELFDDLAPIPADQQIA